MFERNLREALDSAGGQLLALDCDAYPCVAGLLLPRSYGIASGPAVTEGVELLRAFLDDAGYAELDIRFARVESVPGGPTNPEGFLCVVGVADKAVPFDAEHLAERGRQLNDRIDDW